MIFKSLFGKKETPSCHNCNHTYWTYESTMEDHACRCQFTHEPINLQNCCNMYLKKKKRKPIKSWVCVEPLPQYREMYGGIESAVVLKAAADNDNLLRIKVLWASSPTLLFKEMNVIEETFKEVLI